VKDITGPVSLTANCKGGRFQGGGAGVGTKRCSTNFSRGCAVSLNAGENDGKVGAKDRKPLL